MPAMNRKTPEYFCLPIGDMSNPTNVPKRLTAIAHAMQAIIKTWRLRITSINQVENEFHINLQPEPTGQLIPTATIPDALATAEQELRANAARPDPQPHAVAVTTPTLVPPLRAIALYNTETDPPVTYHTEDAVYDIPRLSMDDFVQPRKDSQYCQHVTELITGVYVDKDKAAHMQTREGLHIRMDAAFTKKISPETFGQTLGKTYYVGDITRSGNNEWTTVPGGRLCHQAQLTGVISME